MTHSAIDIPLSLRHALELGECVLFLGAGIGEHLHKQNGEHLPDAAGLAHDIAKHFLIETSSDDLSKVAELVQIRGRKEDLEDFIRKQFADLVPDETIKWICGRRWRAIFTTNYDRGIERAYELLSDPPQKPIPISITAELVHVDIRFEIPVYHIHGAIFGGKQHLVISQSDYSRFREQRRMLFELLKKEFSTSTLLYIGYSNRDPNWALLLNEITEEFLPSKLPRAYRVTPNTDKDDTEILRSRGIEVIDANLEQFVAASAAQLEPFHVDDGRLKALQSTVPAHLLDAFEKNPAPVIRLIASWQYVNQAPFSDAPNTQTFFRGDQPNWALIGAGTPFRRDIEADLYDDVLDYVTGSADKPTTLVVTGPAGYGITTIVMNLAGRLVKERIGPVYFLKAGADLLEGDVDFAIDIAGSSVVCFVVDSAADYGQKLQNTISRLRDTKRSAVFICGSRLNEWRQRNIRISHKEYLVDPLSDDEIWRLLDCLKINHELNKLEPLSRDMQFSVIREKHGKELLVVLREATEDKRFDAILEDEFYGIGDEGCREIYLMVCCFHQHGCFVRDSLLSDLAGIPLADFHGRIKDVLDGILVDECIDATSGKYAYRTRQRTIAHIVWERCGENAQKDVIIQSALDHLNLNYRQDANAFEKFVRNDSLIDAIHGLENKIKFFDRACKKDPDSPYVRQHYARMLYREGLMDLALGQVEQGLEIDPKNPPRVLVHTKGVILGALALQAESKDIGRRRLAQAEDVLRGVIQRNRRDEYAYHALATVYLDWAKHSEVDEESALYLTKAEETISDGLRNCREKDGLWILSADIEKWLGNQPSQIKALEAAVKASPGSIIARYLLGKAYLHLGRLHDALAVLEPNIKNHTSEFRSFVDYSLALWSSGKPLREAIAVLEVASVDGLSDARYIAHLAGMYFLNGDFGKAKNVFGEAERRELPPSELQVVAFLPRQPGNGEPMELAGKVIVRKPAFSLIESEGYPPFFCHSSKYRGLALKEGMRVSFKIGFSPRGAAALEPKEID
ncbi:beta-barrel assembly-enhancing protease [mine drainage metagenome]|uniref:Beta-barrel assembly-enhancing protease n=1 Tax=mine drainage metagenome TaxID=410659 RepID=A0A1J5QF94_9ZZZZ